MAEMLRTTQRGAEEVVRVKLKTKEELKPWEQHSAVNDQNSSF